MPTTRQPPPIARLIEERRNSPGTLKRAISVRAAATRASQLSGEVFSEANWRRIEAGTKKKISDREIVFAAAAINDLSRTDAITPDDIRKAGHDAAADLFNDYIKNQAEADPVAAAIDLDVTQESVLQYLERMLEEVRAFPASDKDRARMEKVLLAQFDSTLKSFEAQLHILRPR
ncbi:hypothetical protein [Streptosporangium sp. H16]|uniref:hypothetical protein n=1 Tax=Streptosporangium sp. H16 TaxID=3444184 RepID=UPI003F7924DB